MIRWLRYRRRLARLYADLADLGYPLSAASYGRLREQARRIPPPGRLQLDLLTVCGRLEQIGREIEAGNLLYAWSLLQSRVLGCDLPRLRRHLDADTLAWNALADDELAARRPR